MRRGDLRDRDRAPAAGVARPLLSYPVAQRSAWSRSPEGQAPRRPHHPGGNCRDARAKNCHDEVRQQILSRETPLTQKDVVQLARKEPEEQRRALNQATANGGKRARTKSQEVPKQSKANEATITVPRAPQAMAQSLLCQLGRKAAAEVHRALGQLLERQASEPGTGRPKGQRTGP
jgi:hypothetical protein